MSVTVTRETLVTRVNIIRWKVTFENRPRTHGKFTWTCTFKSRKNETQSVRTKGLPLRSSFSRGSHTSSCQPTRTSSSGFRWLRSCDLLMSQWCVATAVSTLFPLGYSLWSNKKIDVVNPLSVKLSWINFHPLEVVCRCRDPQLQVGEKYSHLFNCRSNICESWCLNTYFHSL